MELTLEEHSTHFGSSFEEEISDTPGWRGADSQTKARIIEAAQKYVIEGDPQTQAWIGTNTFHQAALAGYRALRLLIKQTPDFIMSLSEEIWGRWGPIILGFPENSPQNKEKEELLKLAYHHTPDVLINTLGKLIERDNKELGHVLVHKKLKHCWDARLESFLVSQMTSPDLKPNALQDLLEVLLEKHSEGAKSFAKTFLAIPVPNENESRKRAQIAAQCLVKHADKYSWEDLWAKVQQNSSFWKDVFSVFAYDHQIDSSGLLLRLGEDQLADLYIWLEQHFPRSQDPEHEGVYTVGHRDALAEWRDSILAHLTNRGTFEACEAIRQITQQLPHLNWLKWRLLESQNVTRQKTWCPPQPKEVLLLASNRDNRLVQSGDELLNVLLESLQRIEGKLQGETPAVIDLWNETSCGKKKIYTPKDETRLSDWVKRQLEEDIRNRGIVVNREVQIRKGTGEGTGETTDIYVDAIVKDGSSEAFDSVSVIIEVKGCWHREVKTAMETQLVKRYLKDNHCQHGLYLVGWFKCDQWDDKDTRKADTDNWDRSEAQRIFEELADKISNQNNLNVKAFVLNTALR